MKRQDGELGKSGKEVIITRFKLHYRSSGGGTKAKHKKLEDRRCLSKIFSRAPP